MSRCQSLEYKYVNEDRVKRAVVGGGEGPIDQARSFTGVRNVEKQRYDIFNPIPEWAVNNW